MTTNVVSIYNGQKNKKRKKINNDLQNITQNKINIEKTRTSLKNWSQLRCSGMISSYRFTSDTRCVIVKRHEHHHEDM